MNVIEVVFFLIDKNVNLQIFLYLQIVKKIILFIYL